MNENFRGPQHSLINLIAWLSLSLLVVGWGPTLDDFWRRIWAQAGAFGLVAAVALVVNDRVQAWRRRREAERQLDEQRQTQEKSLDRFVQDFQSFDSLRAAVHRVIDEMNVAARVAISRKVGPAAPVRLPVTLMPLQSDDARLNAGWPRAVSGFLDEITISTISFVHAEPLPLGRLLAAVELAPDESTGQRIGLVAEILWTQPGEVGGYASGGKLIRVAERRDVCGHEVGPLLEPAEQKILPAPGPVLETCGLGPHYSHLDGRN
ncbi:MAG: hypothetical protein HYS13_18290 [Planctomycetia bacterium]|nr:hypothetical protein [Planctomycetia bacterium]